MIDFYYKIHFRNLGANCGLYYGKYEEYSSFIQSSLRKFESNIIFSSKFPDNYKNHPESTSYLQRQNTRHCEPHSPVMMSFHRSLHRVHSKGQPTGIWSRSLPYLCNGDRLSIILISWVHVPIIKLSSCPDYFAGITIL